jgi:two-component system sensor histidine kinase/response regulator
MKSFNILLVDDIEANILALESLLYENLEDIKILSCNDVNTALKMLIKERVDFIISDVQMPNINGFEFIDLLKKHKKTKDIPIIFITASTVSSSLISKMRGLELGAIDYLTKPIEDFILIPKLRNYIELFRLQQKIKEQDQLLLQQSKQAMMGEMIGMIAHQWRQPITNIKLLVSSIELKAMDENFKKDISFQDLTIQKAGNIKNIVDELSTTITDFIDFFKPNKEKTNINLKQAIEDSIELASASFETNNISVSINCNEDLFLNIYEREFKQVIISILNNAKDQLLLKNSDDRKIIITISKDNEYINVEIFDNGGGINESIIENIFEPYFSTKSQNGTGIGLYMSKIIIENHIEGQLLVENKNDGANFIIKLNL